MMSKEIWCRDNEDNEIKGELVKGGWYKRYIHVFLIASQTLVPGIDVPQYTLVLFLFYPW